MDNPKVSVVIPIYNVEKYLDRCISSVVNQTYENIEIILVDDGSPDNCPTICNDWAKKDNRIKVIHKQNEGLGMARNTGIDHATGDYIFFFDSDDYVDEGIVEKCVEAAQNTCSQAVIFSRFDLYENGILKEKHITSDMFFFEGDSIKNKLLPSMFTYDLGFGISACCKMFDLNLIKENKIKFKSEKEIISEDAIFILEIFTHISRAVIVPECLYFYYKRNNSLSRSFKADRQEKNNIFLEKSLAYIRELDLPETVQLHLTARYHSYTLSAIKQIFSSDMRCEERKTELLKVFKDKTLHSTIKKEVLSLEAKSVRLFFYLVRIKAYNLCYLLLYVRSKKKN